MGRGLRHRLRHAHRRERRRLEAFDIGSDTLTGVNDADYQPPFALTAKLNKLTLKVDRPKLTPEQIKELEEGMKKVEAGRE